MPLWRRDFLQAALGLGLAPLTASSVFAAEGRQGTDTMAKTIVTIHGANEGGWVFDQFKAVFEELGWTCHAPDLIGHGLDAVRADRGPDIVHSRYVHAIVGRLYAEYRCDESTTDAVHSRNLGWAMDVVLLGLVDRMGAVRRHVHRKGVERKNH